MPRPMVVRFGALGDMVLMTVPIRILHERFGEPVDVLGSGPWTRPLLEGQAGVGNIYLMRSRTWPLWLSVDQRRIVAGLRRRGPGPTWLFDANSGTVRRLLHGAGWSDQQLVGLDRQSDISGEHFCDRWKRFAELDPACNRIPVSRPARIAGTSADGSAIPRLTVLTQHQADVEHWLGVRGLMGKTLILLQVGNKRTMHRGNLRRKSNTKYWPLERWATVLRYLRALHPECFLLLSGVPREAKLNDEIVKLANVDGTLNVACEMTVPRLMALAERAIGMITVDTGPAHIAAAVGCATLVLYTCPSCRLMYATRSNGSAARHMVGGTDQRPTLLGITPEQLVEEWRKLIGNIRPVLQTGARTLGMAQVVPSTMVDRLQRGIAE